MTTIITKIPGVTFTDATLPKLYRDLVIDTGTSIVVDGLDTYSWPSQAAPAQSASWVNLVSAGANGSFNTGAAAGGVDITFASGGFKFGSNGGTSFDYARFAGGALPAGEVGLLAIVWLKHVAYTSAETFAAVGGAATDGGGLNQWVLEYNASTGNYRFKANGMASANFVLTNGELAQICVSLTKVNASNGVATNFWVRVYKNGVLLGTPIDTGVAVLRTPTVDELYLGGLPGYQSSWSGHIYRFILDGLSGVGARDAAKVAADYNANVGRFS